MKFCGKSPALRVAAKRYGQPFETSFGTMKPLFAFRLLIFFKLILFSIVMCKAQSDSVKVEHPRFIGIGGYIFSNSSIVSLEYGKRIKNWNELTIPFYFIKEGIRKEIAGSASYHIALVKRRSRFNFFISPELNLAYNWYKRFSSNKIVSRCLLHRILTPHSSDPDPLFRAC